MTNCALHTPPCTPTCLTAGPSTCPQQLSLDHIEVTDCSAFPAGLACGCSGWRWQLQDLMAHNQLQPKQPGLLQQQQQQQASPYASHAQHLQQAITTSYQHHHQQQQVQSSDPNLLLDVTGTTSLPSPPAAGAVGTADGIYSSTPLLSTPPPAGTAAAGEGAAGQYLGNGNYNHHHHHPAHLTQQQQQQEQHQQQQQQQQGGGHQRASPMLVCILDNRGVGRSGSPTQWRGYTTTTMAQDVLRVMVRPPGGRGGGQVGE